MFRGTESQQKANELREEIMQIYIKMAPYIVNLNKDSVSNLFDLGDQLHSCLEDYYMYSGFCTKPLE